MTWGAGAGGAGIGSSGTDALAGASSAAVVAGANGGASSAYFGNWFTQFIQQNIGGTVVASPQDTVNLTSGGGCGGSGQYKFADQLRTYPAGNGGAFGGGGGGSASEQGGTYLKAGNGGIAAGGGGGASDNGVGGDGGNGLIIIEWFV